MKDIVNKESEMIETKVQLKQYLKIEKNLYNQQKSCARWIKNWLMSGRENQIWEYIKLLRKREYYYNNRKKNFFYAVMNLVTVRKFNRLGLKLGIELEKGVFEEGLRVYHTQGIVVNGDATIGKNCVLHGANVIGNKGTDLKAPRIGDNVRLGAGAKILGDVYIANDVQIGAGAVVLHSCYEEGALLVGVPAHIYRRDKK